MVLILPLCRIVGAQEFQEQGDTSIEDQDYVPDASLGDLNRDEETEAGKPLTDTNGSPGSDEQPVEKKKGKLRGKATNPIRIMKGPPGPGKFPRSTGPGGPSGPHGPKGQ
ncbi:hypothetical protein M408DRAFT_132174 [Serendipita vermifera MAFF 305830]|uniref:Uncharacterized protein n=1 Tax=Serendipita vermifera MAFF 305830 TaxID=933852 RepID=A0A0C3AW35_SERVB|nr:hypothetical protein M408DRAFT_132174 [Serendipita vermifera MAFF 305830]